MSSLYPQGLLTDSPVTVDQMVFGYGRHDPQPGLIRPDRESMAGFHLRKLQGESKGSDNL